MKNTRTTFAALDAALARIPNCTHVRARDKEYIHFVVKPGRVEWRSNTGRTGSDPTTTPIKTINELVKRFNLSPEDYEVTNDSHTKRALDAALSRIPDRRRSSRAFTLRGGLDATLARGRDGVSGWSVRQKGKYWQLVNPQGNVVSEDEDRDAIVTLYSMKEKAFRKSGAGGNDVRGPMGGHPPGYQRRMELRASIEELEQQYTDAEGSAKERIKSDLDYAKKELERAKSSDGARDRLDAALARVPDRRRHARDSFGTYKPTDVLKRGDKVRVNMQGEPVEEVMSQEGTQVYFYSGRHAHITNLVPAK